MGVYGTPKQRKTTAVETCHTDSRAHEKWPWLRHEESITRAGNGPNGTALTQKSTGITDGTVPNPTRIPF